MGNLTGTNVQDGYAQKIWWGAILTPFFPIGTLVGIPMLISGIRERRERKQVEEASQLFMTATEEHDRVLEKVDDFLSKHDNEDDEGDEEVSSERPECTCDTPALCGWRLHARDCPCYECYSRELSPEDKAVQDGMSEEFLAKEHDKVVHAFVADEVVAIRLREAGLPDS